MYFEELTSVLVWMLHECVRVKLFSTPMPSVRVEKPEKAMHVSVRMPLSATSLRPSSASRHRRKSSGTSQRVATHTAPPRDSNFKHSPPEERLADTLSECVRLDRELKVIENSGHAKIGAFAKPLGDQQRCRILAATARQDSELHLPEDPTAEQAFVEDDDVTSDPFFQRFFDESGQSMYEQLLRARMRVLALSKMVYSKESVQYVRAEVEMAEVYARMNLWKQAHAHVMAGYDILKTLDAARAAQDLLCRQTRRHSQPEDDENVSRDLFTRAMEYFYDKQRDASALGEVVKAELVQAVEGWLGEPQASVSISLSAVFQPSNLSQLFGAAPYLHWQQLLLRMERQSAMFQDFMRENESRLPETLAFSLRETFLNLDPSRFGVVPLRGLVQSLGKLVPGNPLVSCVSESLSRHDELVKYPSITWSELVHHTRLCFTRNGLGPANDPARDLKPRLKFFFGRFFLRKGQLDDAMRYLQIAIAEEEQLHGVSSSSLVAMYLVLAETLSVRYKQLAVVAQQHAMEIADKWLKSTEGTRRLRSKALELIDASARHQGKVLAKKDAEAQSREELLKEYAALSFVRPDATAIDDALEYCAKAWRLQEETHGSQHVTTASVHVVLAQVNGIKKDWEESVRCYEKAAEIYEQACNGPVPASAWLRLEIAKIYHNHTNDFTAAARGYVEVGDFFHSFAMEFASSDSARRESCTQAIDAWRQWLALASSSKISVTMEDQKQVLTKIHDATVDGYGEFAIEAAESGKEVAQMLVTMGQLRHAERQLRTTWYILESHFGPNDRRSRKARKELLEISSELKGAALDDDDEGHEWLTL